MTARTQSVEALRDDNAPEEERRRLIGLLQEGLDDVKAGRAVGADEVVSGPRRRSPEAPPLGAAEARNIACTFLQSRLREISS
jgi:hypothetical protein